ncbi:sugar phosphate isomerase/epimerase family protein [Rubrobacter calidifluminis]|uniref:sugar phosphate isomerase/epimerase family protein n=1 Tax=Rubrobacter calidifluminis TaxID=1392640 RepID=UPI00236155A6|nr:sugar phosphate isomerase/epimerase [Rubrobacter calidifluminis]
MIPVIFSTGSLHTFGLARIFRWVAEAGYDGVEVMMDDRWDTHQAEYIELLSREHGLPVIALHPPLGRGLWGVDDDETLVRAASLAARVGARVVVAHPPAGRDLESWRDGVLERARSEGVCVAVENLIPQIERRFPFGSRRVGCYLPEHLRDIGGVTLDTSHCAASGVDILQALSALTGQLRHVHLSDSRLEGGDEHRLPGQGKLPLRRFLRELGSTGYGGAVSLELRPRALGAPEEEKIRYRMRATLEYVREGMEGVWLRR